MNKIRLEIISPEKILADLDVDMVVIPGEEGEFGVLYGHVNYIALIKPGVIVIYQNGVITEKFVVSFGSCEVTGKLCTILVDEAVRVEEINFMEMETRLENIKRHLEKEVSDIVKLDSEREIRYLSEALKFKS